MRHVVKRGEREEEPDCPLLPSVAGLLAKVKRTAHGKMRTWRERENYVPIHLHQLEHVCLYVKLAVFAASREKVARIDLMYPTPALFECMCDSTGFLACNKYSHVASLSE